MSTSFQIEIRDAIRTDYTYETFYEKVFKKEAVLIRVIENGVEVEKEQWIEVEDKENGPIELQKVVGETNVPIKVIGVLWVTDGTYHRDSYVENEYEVLKEDVGEKMAEVWAQLAGWNV